MAWFDLQGIIDFLQSIYNGILGLDSWLSQILEAIQDYVMGIVWSLVSFFSYPGEAFADYLSYYVDRMIADVMAPLLTIDALENDVRDLLLNILGLFVDGTTMGIMLACVSLVVILRLYHFLKDISIAGFKI